MNRFFLLRSVRMVRPRSTFSRSLNRIRSHLGTHPEPRSRNNFPVHVKYIMFTLILTRSCCSTKAGYYFRSMHCLAFHLGRTPRCMNLSTQPEPLQFKQKLIHHASSCRSLAADPG